MYREFELWVSSRLQWMLQAPLPPTRTDSPVLTIQQQSGDRTSENVELAVLQRCLCDGRAHSPARPAVRKPDDDVRSFLRKDSRTQQSRTDKGSVWSCGTRGPVTALQGRMRQEEPGRRQKVSRQRNRRTAPAVRRPVIARVNTRTSQLQRSRSSPNVAEQIGTPA